MEKDFPYKSTYDYLNTIGVLENGSEAEIENARKEFRRLYLEHYQKKYDGKHSRITLCYTNEEKKELQKIARTQNKKTATFLKEVIFKSLKNESLGMTRADEKCRQLEILLSLSIDVLEEMIFEHPQFERNLKELNGNLGKMEQILKL